MRKASDDNIWTWYIKQKYQNEIHSFFNVQLKAGRGTCMTVAKCPYYIEHVPQ